MGCGQSFPAQTGVDAVSKHEVKCINPKDGADKIPQECGIKAVKDCSSDGVTDCAKSKQSTQPIEIVALPADCKIIFVLGGPGSGKGTQCERIVAEFGFKHLSAGDLLRAEVASGSDIGQQCAAIMKEGKLVPTEVTIGLLKKAMMESNAKVFLIDGFPRAVDQAKAFEQGIKACDMVLFFDCPEAEMEKRLLNRGKTSGRADDNAETIKKRFRTFVEDSMPVIDYYSAQSKCYRISAVPTPQDVYRVVNHTLTSFQSEHVLPPKEVAAFEADLLSKQALQSAKVIFVLGGPGSGKGTQCERIVAQFGYKHLSAGDLLRAEVASGSDVGRQCAEIMKEGKLVPLEVTIGLLKKAMVASQAPVFLIDGFPRAVDQAQAFEQGIKPCDMVLFFDCPESEMEARLLNRGKTSGRADDNAETIKKRFRTFVEDSMPVIEYYREQNKCYSISAVPTPDSVYNVVNAVLTGFEQGQPVAVSDIATMQLSVETADGQQAEVVAVVDAPAEIAQVTELEVVADVGTVALVAEAEVAVA